MKKWIIYISLALLSSVATWSILHNEKVIQKGALTNSSDRQIWENQMLGDPETGKIPANAYTNELEYKEKINSEFNSSRASKRYWEWIGPNNIGGRTRALQYDQKDPTIILSGSASGGIFRSTDKGTTWIKVTDATHNLAITSLAQNTNAGSENIWYACTGELRGGNQISGNSSYSGDGILKSEDNGKSWKSLSALKNPSPQTNDSTDRGWRIIVSNQNSDVYFASASGIYKSKDGGTTWNNVLGKSNSSSGFTDIIQTKNGTYYAALDASAFTTYGLFRSIDGENWTNISSTIISAPLNRMVLAKDNQFNGERIYVLAVTPNRGKTGEDFRGNKEYHSLYKYTYLTGDGTGSNGVWVNLSANLPVGPEQFDDFITQSSYCMDIAVSPHDSNIVSIAGTNLYISDDAFKTSTNTRFCGGYGEKTKIPDFQLYPNHHPDLQTIVFHPTQSKIMMTGSDGGIHETDDLYASNVIWKSLNNGYASTQFYTLSIDNNEITNRVMGGLQDNGTLLSSMGNPKDAWTLPMSYDGGFCAFSNTEPFLYASKQLDGIAKIEVNAKGERVKWKRIDPVTSANYLFINPNILDPNDNNTMYLPIRGELWWNEKLNDIVLDNTFDKQTKDWNKVNLPASFQPSAIAVSEGANSVIYLGSSTGGILKIETIKSSPKITEITNSIDGKGYINSISLNPMDTSQILVVFSNYNSYSVFTSENSGTTWRNISGNLEGTRTPGIPAGFDYLNNGPSCRVGKIINKNNSTLYLVGTSVGLFQTELLDSLNTEWIPMGEEYLQNNVISDIEYRDLDSSLWVSTFGAGVFKTHLTSNGYISTISTIQNEKNPILVYPIPAHERFTIELKENLKNASFKLFNSAGKLVTQGFITSASQEVKIDQLSTGTYVLIIEQNEKAIYHKKIVLN